MFSKLISQICIHIRKARFEFKSLKDWSHNLVVISACYFCRGQESEYQLTFQASYKQLELQL